MAHRVDHLDWWYIYSSDAMAPPAPILVLNVDLCCLIGKIELTNVLREIALALLVFRRGFEGIVRVESHSDWFAVSLEQPDLQLVR